MPRWLVEEYTDKVEIVPLRLGRRGIAKQIFLGMRDAETDTDYLNAFVELGRQTKGRPSTTSKP